MTRATPATKSNPFRPSLSWLLVFVPAVLALEFTHSKSHVAIFICSCLAILPLAGWLGKATEHLAERTSEGVGGLLNATFGNAAELIIALVALKEGYYGIVKASLTGSIIGNILLVLGAACVAGGLKHKDLKFNAGGARMMSTMLTLAAIALVMPASFHYLVHPIDQPSSAISRSRSPSSSSSATPFPCSSRCIPTSSSSSARRPKRPKSRPSGMPSGASASRSASSAARPP